MRQLKLRVWCYGNREPASGCADICLCKPGDDLFGREQHSDGDRWVGDYSKVADR